MVEMESDEILRDAQNVDVAFLVVGDPFGSVYNYFEISILHILIMIIELLHTQTWFCERES